jgi:lipopolysaccharide/colanic/teichoic acid biosynthesis glycosyltransferase
VVLGFPVVDARDDLEVPYYSSAGEANFFGLSSIQHRNNIKEMNNNRRLFSSFGNTMERRSGIRILHGLHSRESTLAGLRRERLRSDRTGDPFCWVLFGISNLTKKGLSLQRLAHVIAERARCTDEVGWHDDASVGVILPATDRAGAEQFVADVVRIAARKHLEPTVTIQVYPERSTSASGSNSGRTSRSGDRPWMPEMVSIGGGQEADASDSIPSTAVPFLARPISPYKRLADIVGSVLGLLLAAPILALAAMAVRLSSPGPILFGQRRAGLGCSPFTMYKFRSMYLYAEERKHELRYLNEQDGPAFKIKDDPRITPVGRFLRATSIDELPQLFNVLKGDMSLVGPRPPTFDEVCKYRRWYLRRLDVTPGLTCTWQVEGRSRVTFEEWMRMDLQYIDQQSAWLDLKLIAKTLPALILRRGY